MWKRITLAALTVAALCVAWSPPELPTWERHSVTVIVVGSEADDVMPCVVAMLAPGQAGGRLCGWPAMAALGIEGATGTPTWPELHDTVTCDDMPDEGPPNAGWACFGEPPEWTTGP